jgi:hypothetical protein
MSCRCRCCEKTGACCVGESCTQETCSDCNDLGGVFQGVDTECVDGECPCDPPASPPKCEKCVDGEPTGFCSEADCCTDGKCKECPPPYCPDEPCTGDDCCVDGQCLPCPEYECPAEPCGTGECCVDGYCIPCPDYGCTGEEECEEGECCIDGECVPCDPCSPGDCGEGQCCVDGQCYPCPPPPDDPCSPGSCPPGECCVNGYCLPCPPEECPDPPCPSGECCINGYCINPCAPGEYCCDGECQSEPCEEPPPPTDCDDNFDCPEGQCCVDGQCQDQYCIYIINAVWQGEGEGECPAGFKKTGLFEGKSVCVLCESIQEQECDEVAWSEGKAPTPPESWLWQDGSSGSCEQTPCGDACDPDYECPCDGCVCTEVEESIFECVAEDPPP